MTHGTLVESIRLSTSASIFMTENSDEHAPNETGGILLGVVHATILHIVQATPPGPLAEHTPTTFKRDGAFSQRQLDEAVAVSGGFHDYAGEWHSHPFAMGPSAKDVASMQIISQRSTYQCTYPVMLLCRRHRRAWRIDAFQWGGSRLDPRPLEVVDDRLSPCVPQALT